MIPNMESDEYAFFVMFMSRLAEEGMEIYAYCNLHGLWKNIVK